jgi:hypothetical protein
LIGDVRADIDASVFPHVVCDAARLPFADKWHKFRLAEVYVWQPRTYFGRVQVITDFDASLEGEANRADHDVASARTPIFRSPEGDCVRLWLSYSRGDDVRELLLRMAELNRLTHTP